MIEFNRAPAWLEDIDERRFVCWGWRDKDGKRTKPPLKPGGEFASTSNPKTWRTLSAALKALERQVVPLDGLGYVMTEDTERIAFDLDHCRNPETGVLAPWAREILARADTYAELTPSGEGARAIGTVPAGWRSKAHKPSIPMPDGGSLEIYYHTERYITVTGVMVPGAPEDLADISAIADEFLDTVAVEHVANGADDAGAPSLNELIDTVWKISPEVERGDWIKVGHAIKAAGEVWPEDTEKLWLDWSFSSEKYKEDNQAGAAQTAWDGFKPERVGFGTLVYLSEEFPAPEAGIETVELFAQDRGQMDFQDRRDQLMPEAAAFETILNPPGLVGELSEYTGQAARRDTPLLNILAGLACVSTISGNGFVVQLPGGLTPLNLYLLGVAGTGAGKENIRATCMRALHAAGMGDAFLDYVASDAGLHRVLGDEVASAPILWSCDEFGRYLKAAANVRTGGHQYAVLTYAMRLFGLALSTASARPRADKKETLPAVTCPYLSALLTTTPHELHTALSSAEVVNGVLSRLVALHVPAAPLKPRNRTPAPTGFSETLARKITGLKAAADGAWKRNERRPQVQCMGRWFTVITPDDAAGRALEDFEYAADELSQIPGTISELWTRTFENAVRIAGVVAIGDQAGYTAPIMTMEHAEYGIALAHHTTEAMVRAVQDNVADSPFQAQCNWLMAKIKSVAAKPPAKSTETDLAANAQGIVTRNQIGIANRAHLNEKELEASLKGLVSAGRLSPIKLGQIAKTHQGAGYRVDER